MVLVYENDNAFFKLDGQTPVKFGFHYASDKRYCRLIIFVHTRRVEMANRPDDFCGFILHFLSHSAFLDSPHTLSNGVFWCMLVLGHSPAPSRPLPGPQNLSRNPPL